MFNYYYNGASFKGHFLSPLYVLAADYTTYCIYNNKRITSVHAADKSVMGFDLSDVCNSRHMQLSRHSGEDIP